MLNSLGDLTLNFKMKFVLFKVDMYKIIRIFELIIYELTGPLRFLIAFQSVEELKVFLK